MGPVRLFLIAAYLIAVSLATAADVETQARDILNAHKSAVITVEVVVRQKMSFGGMGDHENDSKVQTKGTVVTPDGLTVVALSSFDSSALFELMSGAMEGMGQEENFKMDMSNRIIGAKLILEDGTELRSDVVLRDKELDLAYFRPFAKPKAPLSYINLADAAAPQVPDQIVQITRLGQVADRQAAADIDRIKAIVHKPRKFYVTGVAAAGCPAFTLDGKLVGIGVLRSVKSDMGAMSLLSQSETPFMPITLPPDEIEAGAKQAVEIKMKEPGPEETTQTVKTKKRTVSNSTETTH